MNVLEHFSLMDLDDLKRKIISEETAKQAESIIERFKTTFRIHPEASYMSMTDCIVLLNINTTNANANMNVLYEENIKHLKENGFQVWVVYLWKGQNGKSPNNNKDPHAAKYFIGWTVKDVETEVYNPFLESIAWHYERFDCTEL